MTILSRSIPDALHFMKNGSVQTQKKGIKLYIFNAVHYSL